MMTEDIVTRLRNNDCYDCELVGEAADEIERLYKWREIAYALAFSGKFTGENREAIRRFEKAVRDE